MATTVSGPAQPAAAETNALRWLTEWIKGHRQAATYVGVVLALAAGLFGLALDSRNYPLAASVLAQVVENYSGTHAAQEGAILLAQVRLAQGQTQQAIDVLQRYAPKADKDFRAQAYGLLGAACENALKPKDAGVAYEQAAAAAQYPFLRAQFLADAGRAWIAAADTARALAAYRTIVQQLDSTGAVGEAKVRIGELTKGATDVAK